LRCNCKKCQYVWDQPGAIDKNGVPNDNISYHCPRCGTENGKSPKDLMRETYKKLGLKEPEFFD